LVLVAARPSAGLRVEESIMGWIDGGDGLVLLVGAD
jgi:hypothetical protein